MTVINDSIWAVRDLSPILTTTNGTVENWKYLIDFYAPSLTFDGNNLWIVDTTTNKIKKMETVPFSVKKTRPAYQNIQIYPNPTNDFIYIQNLDQLTINTLEIFDINSKSILFLKMNNNQIFNISYFKS
jgi:hypothetical protein